MCKGFKQISNDFFESDYWRQSRTYNECEAVLDIANQVRFEASEHYARIGGREVVWGQAQWPASVRFLAARWHWTERRVRTFISHLRRRGIIETDDSQGVNIITLKKYLVIGDTANDTQSDTANALNISELDSQVTQPLTQQTTQPTRKKSTSGKKRHSIDTKHYNGDNIDDSSLRSESLLFDIPEELPFSDFWDLYDKKIDKDKCEKLYAKLSLKDRKAIFEYVPKYVSATPNKAFRKNPTGFLRNRGWEDEIIIRNNNEAAANNRTSRPVGSPSDEQLINDTYDLINEARARETVID
jgi:hypothetical protein